MKKVRFAFDNQSLVASCTSCVGTAYLLIDHASLEVFGSMDDPGGCWFIDFLLKEIRSFLPGYM